MKVYLITLFDQSTKWRHKVIFQHYPTYKELLYKLPNELRVILASGSNEVKFDLSLGCEFSSPLFKGNPSGPELFDKSIANLQTFVGRLTVERIKIHK